MSAEEQIRLVKKAVKGDPDAYGTLIAEHQEYLYKMAYLYVRNEDAALDVVGSAILSAYQSIRTLKEPEYFKTWLTRINSAIEQLSEKYRTVIYLKYFSEFTIKEIAFAMDAPEGSVKAYLSRAREELKRILKEDYLYAN